MRKVCTVGSFVLLLAVCGLWASSTWAGEPQVRAWAAPARRAPTELLVKYRVGTAGAAALGTGPGLAAWGVARVPLRTDRALSAQSEEWVRRPDVEWVQPNGWRYAQAVEVVPNDPYYLPQRNQRRYQQWAWPKVNANYAWSLTKGGAGLTVAVLDTGVDLDHPDLKDRVAAGISIVNQKDYSPPAGGRDDNGHGTHVAGLIGAATDNGVGVAGCTWTGRMLSVKVLDQEGAGTDADIAEGIRWAADQGARIINLSLGGTSDTGEAPAVLQAAVDHARARGCLLLAASGNTGDRQIIYPAALPGVVAVAATDPWDQRAEYSTSGSFVALAAPGGAGGVDFGLNTGILSTYWNKNSVITDRMGGAEAGEYAVLAGTSMASAVASGAAALVWSHTPALSAGQVEDLLKSTAVDVGAPGPDPETGNGRIDVLAALGSPAAERPDLTLYTYPNPFSPGRDGAVRIVFLLDRPGDVRLSIYDVSRDLVWTQAYGADQTLSGKNVKLWDGRNGVGEPVANGAYYLRLTAADGRASDLKVIAVLK